MELVRLQAVEAYSIADLVAPKSARCGDDHGIIASGLHLPQRHSMGMGLPHLLEGDELVKDIIVDHEKHGGGKRVVLDAEESLRGIVGLYIVHVGIGNQATVLLTVRGECHTTMKEDLEVGPHLRKVGLPRLFEHTVDDAHHPRGYTGKVGDTLGYSLVGNTQAFRL